MARGEGRLWDAFIPTVRHVKSGSVDLTKLTENCIKIEFNSRRDFGTPKRFFGCYNMAAITSRADVL